MVEKIIVSPESIRALGNIVVPKTGADFEEYNCALEVGEDTVNGETVTVYVLTPETTTISLVLSSSVGSCGIGDSVVLSVTVTEDSVPVSGASVSFKLGGTEIGTGTTNSSGVATYTYTATDVGSLNFTSVYAGHSSNSVSVVVSHDYSIAFSQSSYVATGGSATLEITLLDNNVAVSGATVSVSGSDGSLYTGITNSSGIATVTVTVNSDTTFTASYSNVSATCTVTTGPTYLFYDACDSASGLSNYGSSVPFSGSSSNTLAFATNEYVMSGSGGHFSGRELTALSGVDDCKVRIKFKLNTTSDAAFNQFCIIATDQTPSSTERKYPYGTRVRNDKLFQYFTMSTESTIYTNSVAYSTGWYYLEAEKDSTSWTISLYDSNLNKLATNTRTLTAMTGTVKWYMVIQTEKGTNYSVHIQEIKAEAL